MAFADKLKDTTGGVTAEKPNGAGFRFVLLME